MSSVVAVSGVLAINGLLGILTLVALVAEVIAFVDSLTHPPAAYIAASKQTKLSGRSCSASLHSSPC